MIDGWTKERSIESHGEYTYGELFDLMTFRSVELSLPTPEELKSLFINGKIGIHYLYCWDTEKLKMEHIYKDDVNHLYLWREI